MTLSSGEFLAVFVPNSFQKKFITLNCDVLKNVQDEIYNRTLLLPQDYFLVQNGLILKDDSTKLNGYVHLYPRILGGKGGFGSMLRAIGAQIEKTTNREACRDLSGRRLRDINEEQRLKKWISQQAEREREEDEKKKKKIEKLLSEPKHEFKDESYEAERTKMSEALFESVEEGLKASSTKRKTEELEKSQKKKKKKKLLIDDDLSSSSSDSESTSSK